MKTFAVTLGVWDEDGPDSVSEIRTSFELTDAEFTRLEHDDGLACILSDITEQLQDDLGLTLDHGGDDDTYEVDVADYDQLHYPNRLQLLELLATRFRDAIGVKSELRTVIPGRAPRVGE